MKTILLVDDDTNVRRSIRYVLKNQGYRIVEAHTGAVAIEMLRREPVDLVVLDLVMPEMDGTMVCDRIRSTPQWAQLPVIIFTVMRGELCRDWQHYVKADACLIKPFQVGELLAVVKKLLGRTEPSPQPAAQTA
ncbi:MAG: response regulator [Nitrospirae bacterium]|nr:response regulator [Nitrospirota bacterium]